MFDEIFTTINDHGSKMNHQMWKKGTILFNVAEKGIPTDANSVCSVVMHETENQDNSLCDHENDKNYLKTTTDAIVDIPSISVTQASSTVPVTTFSQTSTCTSTSVTTVIHPLFAYPGHLMKDSEG